MIIVVFSFLLFYLPSASHLPGASYVRSSDWSPNAEAPASGQGLGRHSRRAEHSMQLHLARGRVRGVGHVALLPHPADVVAHDVFDRVARNPAQPPQTRGIGNRVPRVAYAEFAAQDGLEVTAAF